MPLADASNVRSHRAPTSVWEKRGWRGPTVEEQLVPWLVSLVGAGLFAFGASRQGRGAPHMVAGAALLGCAAAWVWHPRENRVRLQRSTSHPTEPDTVTIEAMDSFPASDAPSSNATTVAGGRSIDALA